MRIGGEPSGEALTEVVNPPSSECSEGDGAAASPSGFVVRTTLSNDDGCGREHICWLADSGAQHDEVATSRCCA